MTEISLTGISINMETLSKLEVLSGVRVLAAPESSSPIEDHVAMETPSTMDASSTAAAPPLSKNKIKKLKRDQAWEDNRQKRKVKRKEKVQEKKQRKRNAREEAGLAIPGAVDGGVAETHQAEVEKARWRNVVQVPITLVIDCGFDDLMHDGERKSLCSQITRCYSDNHKAPFRAHLAISSFGGHLKERFDNVLSSHHQSWRGVRFLEDNFVEVADQAQEWMKGAQGGKCAGALISKEDSKRTSTEDEKDNAGEVIYLTSDSPCTLEKLLPNSTYIIGGIVDRNRHKGICYKKAMDWGMKTAKLPIGDYMQMSSRFVLATNHVVEIMLRWLELGDWGEAFLQVVPKRKGGVLKGKVEDSNDIKEPVDSSTNDSEAPLEQPEIESTLAERTSPREETQEPPAHKDPPSKA